MAGFTVEVVPDGLWVEVAAHAHDTVEGPVPCTRVVTRGLAALGQRELILTLLRRADEPPAVPSPLLRLLATIHGLAADGRRVGPGDVTEFSLPGDLGDVRGCGYLAAEPLADVEHALAMILLLGEEAAVWRSYGPGRVKALLGMRARYYPCPPWSELGRAPVTSLAAQAQSLLADVARVYLPGVRVRRSGGRVHLRVSADARARLAELLPELPPDRPVALLADFDPGANACLVWSPGQQAPAAISAPGSDAGRLAGNFIAFVPQQSYAELRLHEDGFVALLQDDTWAAVRRALAAGEALAVPGGELTLDLAPLEEPPARGRAVRLRQITLLTGETELAVRVAQGALSRYIRALAAAAAEHTPPGLPAHELALRVELAPAGREALQLTARPAQDPAATAGLAAALAAVPTPPVLGLVVFELSLSCA
jgi:hypothetical protein